MRDRRRAALGDDGLLARYGGEEFSVLLTGATVRRAEEVLERCAAPRRRRSPCPSASRPGTASHRSPTPSTGPTGAVRGQVLGRDRVVVHEGDRAVPVDRSDRVAPLSRHVVGVFQPVVELATGTVRSYDARARLPRLRASESSQAAKRAGFGPAVEAAALALALDGHREGVPVQVSLSAEGLRDADLLARLPADLSTVRIVVRAADLDDRSGVMGLLPALRERGATLMYLHDVPVAPDLAGVAMLGIDAVAVDAGLVRAPDSWGRPELLTDLVAWAGERRLPLLAEDVRTEAERDVLRRLGVTAGSGRLFDGIAGRPARDAATGAGLGLTAALGAPV